MSKSIVELNTHSRNVSRRYACGVFFCLCSLLPAMAYVQTQSAETKPTGVLVIKVRPTVNGKWKKFPRKRFYLIKGSLEDNKALLEKVRQQPILTRECFYRNANASEPFISWLTSEDICESVYCRDIEEKFLSGSTAVPEFQEAYER